MTWNQCWPRRLLLLGLIGLFTVYSLVLASNGKRNSDKTTRPRRLGDNLTQLTRDAKTGRLMNAAAEKKEASYVEKSDTMLLPPGEDDVITLDSKLFAFEVTVQDPKTKRYILDLKEEDFLIYDDETQQPVTYYVRSEVEKVPTNIVLILDRSGSLAPYWEESKRAALNFIRQIKPDYQSVALVLDDPTLLVDFTNDPAVLEKALNKVKPTKHTYNFTSLLAVLQEMFVGRDGRKIVIFQTDGDEALKLIPRKDWPEDVTVQFDYEPKFYSLRDVIDFAANSGVTVYPIAVGLKLVDLAPDANTVELTQQFEAQGRDPRLLTYFRECQQALKQVASVTGGSISYMSQASDAEGVYHGIKEDLRARYIIGYYPVGGQTNRYHRISVRIKGHPEWQVNSRQGYYADNQ